MAKKSNQPETRVKNPEPAITDPDWIIWAAWADRITFEEIEERTGRTEAEVIRLMRQSLKPASFRRWRRRATGQSLKHRKKFEQDRKRLKQRRDFDLDE